MTEQNTLSLLHVLYVEDEAMTREELSRFLRRRVAKLSVAENGREALAQFETSTPDVLITDLRMPDMDGLELAKQIRMLGHKIPIIVTSALSDSETILSAVDRGIVKYIVKPIDAGELETALLQIAQEVLTRQKGHEMRDRLLNDSERLQLEKNLARDISALLKTATGKGPKRLRVKIQAAAIQVQIDGMLTPLENTLLKGAQSPEALALNRQLLYKTLSKQLTDICLNHLGVPATLSEYKGFIREDKEEVYLIINPV